MRLHPPFPSLALPLLAAFVLAGCGAPEEPLGTAEQAIKVCPGPVTLEGIDVSHWDGTVDWAKVKASGRDFAIIKATESTGFVDNTFATNWAGMKANGVVRSAYHFFHADVDPIAQADHFLQTMGPLEVGDLPPTLDLEMTNGQSGDTITANTIKWLDHVQQATGMKPLLYTSPGFIGGLGNAPVAQALDTHATLWVAHWGVMCPTVPAPFTTWAFWQYDDMGTVSGIDPATAVDLNKFNGTLDDLKALTLQDMSSSSSSSSGGGGAGGSGAGGSGAGGAAGGSGGAGGGTTTHTGAGTGGGGSSSGGPLEPASKGGCACTVVSSDDSGGAGVLAALSAFAVAFVRSARRKRR